MASATHSHENIGTTSSDSTPKVPNKKSVDTDTSNNAESGSNLVDDTQYTTTHIKPITEIVPNKDNTNKKFKGGLIHAPSGNASYKVKPSE